MFNVYQLTRNWFERQEIEVDAQTQVTSTNDLAKNEAFSLSSALKVYLTDQQTHGRGRNQSHWLNVKPGDGLQISFSLDPQGAPQPIASPLVGLAIYKAAMHAFPDGSFSLKPPNDLFLQKNKTAGVLVEVSQMGESFRLIIGLGMNVFSSPEKVSEATHLQSQVDVTIAAWEEFLSELTLRLRDVTRACAATHLTEFERQELLTALNRNPNLTEKLDQVSPFGDLVAKSGTQIWRTL